MSGTFHRIWKASRIAVMATADPLETWTRVRAKVADLGRDRRTRCPYSADSGWEEKLHAILGAPWPCPEASAFWDLWPQVVGPLISRGLQIGPRSFGVSNDGEPELVRAIWCLARHLRPIRVVETGVARGLTSRFILEALLRNGNGHLWSIDLPPLAEPELHAQIGAAVEGPCRQRWSYIRGSSRRHLPRVLSQLGQVDLFVHDSAHTERNMQFELEHACRALPPTGALVVDDIDLTGAFHDLMRTHPHRQFLICQAEPLQPDLRRFNGRGLFGIMLGQAAWSPAEPS